MFYPLRRFFTLFFILLTLLSAQKADTVMVPIVFEGNKIVSTSALEDVIGAIKPPAYAFWRDKTAKIDAILRPKLNETYKLFYETEGFYDANISTKVSEKGIIVMVEENQAIVISNINIDSDLDLSEVKVSSNELLEYK